MVRPQIPDMDPDKRARLDKIYEQRKQCEKRKGNLCLLGYFYWGFSTIFNLSYDYRRCIFGLNVNWIALLSELAARTVESSEKSVDPCFTDIFSKLLHLVEFFLVI